MIAISRRDTFPLAIAILAFAFLGLFLLYPLLNVFGASFLDRTGKIFGGREFATAHTIRADEVRVAEFAHRVRTVALKPGPQIAAGEAQEHRRTSRPRSLTLQGVVNFFDGVSHAALYFA